MPEPAARQQEDSARKREADMYQMVKEGATLAKIGEQYGISGQRVRQIVRRHRDRLAAEESRAAMLEKGLIEGLGLSTRAQNALKNSGINTIRDAVLLLDGVSPEGHYVRNVGAVTLTELAERMRQFGVLPAAEPRPIALPADLALPAAKWKAAQTYWQERCAVCGCGDVSLQQDHWIPRSRRMISSTSVTNIVPLCPDCNLDKSAQDPYLWLVAKLGQESAEQKMRDVFDYFDWWRAQT